MIVIESLHQNLKIANFYKGAFVQWLCGMENSCFSLCVLYLHMS